LRNWCRKASAERESSRASVLVDCSRLHPNSRSPRAIPPDFSVGTSQNLLPTLKSSVLFLAWVH
jgi:hypothetical protein